MGAGICVSKSIGLAYSWKENLPFLLCFTLYLRANAFNYKLALSLRRAGGREPWERGWPPGAYIWRVFCVTSFGGVYLEGLIFGIFHKFGLLIFCVSISCFLCLLV